MDDLMLCIDGSVNPQSHIGYGAYLAVSERGSGLDSLKTRVKVRRFEQTSSTKLELQTLLWAFGEIQAMGCKVTVYTDSQTILGLPARRNGLEKKGFRTKKNTRLKHDELYRAFYRVMDQLDCKLIKVRGHQVADQKDDADRIFALVDRASRKALREEGEQRDH